MSIKAVNRSGGWRVFCIPRLLAAARLPWSITRMASDDETKTNNRRLIVVHTSRRLRFAQSCCESCQLQIELEHENLLRHVQPATTAR